MKLLVPLLGCLFLASCASAPSPSIKLNEELKYARMLREYGMSDYAYLVLSDLPEFQAIEGKSKDELSLTTPETFEFGLTLIDYMIHQGKWQQARDYAERHKDVDPVIYWAFQIYIGGNNIHNEGMQTYENFLSAYQNRYSKEE